MRPFLKILATFAKNLSIFKIITRTSCKKNPSPPCRMALHQIPPPPAAPLQDGLAPIKSSAPPPCAEWPYPTNYRPPWRMPWTGITASTPLPCCKMGWPNSGLVAINVQERCIFLRKRVSIYIEEKYPKWLENLMTMFSKKCGNNF